MSYVLDTHVLIWYFIGSKRLKFRAKEVIDKCITESRQLLIPTIVLAEALDITEEGKVKFDFQGMYDLIKEEPAFEIIGFTQEIFEVALNIRGISEIHDRIIVATAKFYSADMITKDRIIRDSGEVETL